MNEERDSILYEAAQELLALPGDLQTEAAIVSRVVIVVELHDEHGEPFVRAVATESSEWWNTLGLLAAADRILTPGHDPVDAEQEE